MSGTHLNAVNRKFDTDMPLSYNWYKDVGLTPDDIIEACRRKGVLTTQKRDMIKAWGTKLLKPLYHTRKKTADEKIRGSVASKNYELTIKKQAAKKALNDCTIAYGDDPDELTFDEKQKCTDFVCNARNRVDSNEKYNDVYAALPASGKIKLDRCRSLNSHICNDPRTVDYPINKFLYAPNSGIGDCLFIAYNYYLYLEEEVPNAVRENRPVNGLFDIYTKVELDRARPISRAAKNTRKQVVNWLRNNRNSVYNVSMTGPDTFLKQICLHSLGFGNTYGATNGIIEFNRTASHEHKFPTNNQTVVSELNSMDKHRLTNRSYYNRLICLCNKIYDKYLVSMSKITTYGTQIEIEVLSRIHGRPVIVLTNPAGIEAGDSYFSYMVSSNYGAENPIYIMLNADFDAGNTGNHYEVLFPLTTSYLALTPTPSEQYIDFLVEWHGMDREEVVNEAHDLGFNFIKEARNRITLAISEGGPLYSDNFREIKDNLDRLGMKSTIYTGLTNAVKKYLNPRFIWSDEVDAESLLTTLKAILPEQSRSAITLQQKKDLIKIVAAIIPYQRDLILQVSKPYLLIQAKKIDQHYNATGKDSNAILEFISTSRLPKAGCGIMIRNLKILGDVAAATINALKASCNIVEISYYTVCPTCTFVNPPDTKNCQMCGSSLKKPPTAPVPAPAPAPVPVPVPVPAKLPTKQCPTCTFENPIDATNCGICDEKLINKISQTTKICKSCTFENASDASVCTMCNSKFNVSTKAPAKAPSKVMAEDDETDMVTLEDALIIIADNIGIKCTRTGKVCLHKILTLIKTDRPAYYDIQIELIMLAESIFEQVHNFNQYMNKKDRIDDTNNISLVDAENILEAYLA